MKLFLVRHAAAVERDGDVPEEWRYLTPEGRKLFRKTARTMANEGVTPDLIITSPLLRAVQTADVLAETLAYGGPLVARGELQPGFDPEALCGLLDECRSLRELVLVGHEPDLSGLVASLLNLSGDFSFKKGGAIRLKIDPADPQGTVAFKWLAVGSTLTTTPEKAFAR